MLIVPSNYKDDVDHLIRVGALWGLVVEDNGSKVLIEGSAEDEQFLVDLFNEQNVSFYRK